MIKSMQNHLFEIRIKKDPRLCLTSSVIAEKITNNIKSRVLNRNDFSTLFFDDISVFMCIFDLNQHPKSHFD